MTDSSRLEVHQFYTVNIQQSTDPSTQAPSKQHY